MYAEGEICVGAKRFLYGDQETDRGVLANKVLDGPTTGLQQG